MLFLSFLILLRDIQVEKAELNEFELLEEAAANCSLSSNSSTVLRILSQKKAQAELDKNNNPTATVPEWRNIGKGKVIAEMLEW